MLEPKVLAIGASTGFVLSFLTGLFSGAAFAIVLLRAVCMAVFFGVLVTLGRMVILRFIPELVNESQNEAAPEEKTGNFVNITVGDNAKEPYAFGDSGNNDSHPAEADAFDQIPDFDTGGQMQSVGGQSGSEPSKTGKQPSSGSANAIPAPKAPVTTVDGLDVLPDLEDFMPQQPVGRDDEGDEESHSFGPVHSSDSMFVANESGSTSVETETMAKAIRTILSKDN
jgi:hypothetical protein